MPFYQMHVPAGSLSPQTKADLAAGIVEMHLRLAGGLKQFVNVLIHEYAPDNFYVGGEPNSRYILTTMIRAGRSKEVRANLLHEYSALFSRITGIDEHLLLVGLEEAQASNLMEGGHVLPEPGQEAEWLAKVLKHADAH